MTRASSANLELRRAVALRTGTRSIALQAFRLNMLGLNAILHAQKFGARARGFGVISDELRNFGSGLRQQMTGLAESGAALVRLAARDLNLERRASLMRQAGSHARLVECADAFDAERTAVSQAMAREHRRLGDWVSASRESCLFGSVIARAALIEAAHAGSGGQPLVEASEDFAQCVSAILPDLDLLDKAVRTHH